MDKILYKTYESILEDSKLIKLATITTLPYSLIFVLYLFYQTYFVISTIKTNSINLEWIKKYIDIIVGLHNEAVIFWLIWLLIIILIMYFLVPPIAEWSIISYLNSTKKSISKSIWVWIISFFKMFEFHWLTSIFSFLFFIIVVSRLYAIDMLNNFYTITIVCIWFVIILILSFLLVYTKYYIILEKQDLWEAMWNSCKKAFTDIGLTSKFVIWSYILYVRFIFNILIVIGIPLLLFYIILKTNANKYHFVQYIVFTIVGLLVLLTAYINGIIEAYFISMWNNIYHKIDEDEKDID